MTDPRDSGRHDADLGSGSVAKRCINVKKTVPSAKELSPHKRGIYTSRLGDLQQLGGFALP